jgi:selenocysteine-specific elongation factor
MVSLVSASASLSGDFEQLAAIAQAYRDAGLAAPLVPELAQRFQLKEAEMRRLVTLLQRQKAIVRMGSDDLFMHVSALDGLASRMESQRGKLIDVASFKQLTGLSRKYAIPLLEYLDRARITRKQGDQRLVV